MTDQNLVTDSDFRAGDMPPMPFHPEDDFVGEGLTTDLYGATVDYTYSRGNHYQLVFDRNQHVTFHYLNAPPMPEGFGGPPLLPYRARVLREGQYLVHWLVKPANIHVSVIIDVTEKRVDVAAMMPPNKWEFFDTATIHSVTYD